MTDLGKAGLAIAVLGAACTTAEPNPEDVTTATTETPTTAGPGTSLPPTTQRVGATDFKRVNLDFVSAYILYRAGEAALVDTGVAESSEAIGLALSEVGLSWDSIGHLIVTHKHLDHQGSVEEVLALTPDVPVYAGAADIPAITATNTITPVGDGDRVFDLDIIASPGHTPGHVSVLDAMSGILVAGDALNGTDRGVTGANPGFSEDMTAANATVVKLAGFDYRIALFGHGEPILHDASRAVAALAATLV